MVGELTSSGVFRLTIKMELDHPLSVDAKYFSSIIACCLTNIAVNNIGDREPRGNATGLGLVLLLGARG